MEVKPTQEQINRIVGLALGREDGFTGWIREAIDGEDCIVFGSNTFPQHRRWIKERDVIPKLEEYDARGIGAGI